MKICRLRTQNDDEIEKKTQACIDVLIEVGLKLILQL